MSIAEKKAQYEKKPIIPSVIPTVKNIDALERLRQKKDSTPVKKELPTPALPTLLTGYKAPSGTKAYVPPSKPTVAVATYVPGVRTILASSTAPAPTAVPVPSTTIPISAPTTELKAEPTKQPPAVEPEVSPITESKTETEPVQQPEPEVAPVTQVETVQQSAVADSEIAPVIESKIETEPVQQPEPEVAPVTESKTETEPVQQPPIANPLAAVTNIKEVSIEQPFAEEERPPSTPELNYVFVPTHVLISTFEAPDDRCLGAAEGQQIQKIEVPEVGEEWVYALDADGKQGLIPTSYLQLLE